MCYYGIFIHCRRRFVGPGSGLLQSLGLLIIGLFICCGSIRNRCWSGHMPEYILSSIYPLCLDLVPNPTNTDMLLFCCGRR